MTLVCWSSGSTVSSSSRRRDAQRASHLIAMNTTDAPRTILISSNCSSARVRRQRARAPTLPSPDFSAWFIETSSLATQKVIRFVI
jgi:hypothetical protein